MDARLLATLVCPVCKGNLHYDREGQRLLCEADRLAYPIRDGLPVMIEAQAQSMDAAEALVSAPLAGV